MYNVVDYNAVNNFSGSHRINIYIYSYYSAIRISLPTDDEQHKFAGPKISRLAMSCGRTTRMALSY